MENSPPLKKNINSLEEKLTPDINLNKINNVDNFIEKIKSSTDSVNSSLLNSNKRLFSIRKPLKKIINKRIRKLNSLLVNNNNIGSLPVCFSSMTNKKNFNNILNYKLKINDFEKKSDFNKKEIFKDESILNSNKIKLKKLNNIDINFKFSSPTINVNINNIITRNNKLSRNQINPQIGNFSNLLSMSQLNTFSKDYYLSLNNSSNASNIIISPSIKINQSNTKDIIRQKIYNKNQMNLKKHIISPLTKRVNEINLNLKNTNYLFPKKNFLSENSSKKQLKNENNKKLQNKNNSINNIINDYKKIIKKLKIPELYKKLFQIERRDINPDSKTIQIKNISFNNEIINNNMNSQVKSLLNKKSNLKNSKLLLKNNNFPLKKIIKFNSEDEPKIQLSNIKINKNKIFKLNLKDVINNEYNSDNSCISQILQKNENNSSLNAISQNQQNIENNSTEGNQKLNFDKRKKKLINSKNNSKHISNKITEQQTTKIIGELKNIHILDVKSTEEKIIDKNKFLKKLYMELIDRNIDKKLKSHKINYIEKKKDDILLLENELMQKSNNYNDLSKEEIKIIFENIYINEIKKNKLKNKSYNDFNKNCELYINKIKNSKKYLLLDINLISFLLKSMYLSSIFLPNLSKNNSNDELNDDKLMPIKRKKNLKNILISNNKSKFRENKYDIEFIGTNSLFIYPLIKKDLIDEEVDDEDNISEKDDYAKNILDKISTINISSKSKPNISNEEDKNKISILKSFKMVKTLKSEDFSLLKLKEFFENQSKNKSKKKKSIIEILNERNNEHQKVNQIYKSIRSRRKSLIINVESSEEDDEKKKEDEFYNYLRNLLVSGELDSFNEYFDSANKFFNINKKDEKGNTLLILAALHGHNSIIKKLIEKGADINEKNNRGNTALHYAISQKYFSLADILKKYGAKEDIRNIYGFTPWECLGKSI